MSQTPKLLHHFRNPDGPRRSTVAGGGDDVMGATRPAGEGPRQIPQFTRRHLLYLLGFTLVAAVLRLWNLGAWSFWVDEAHTFRDVTAPLDEFLDRGTGRYPVSFMVIRGVAELFGVPARDMPEGLMRLPFAFFGIVSVPAMAVVARDMIGRRSALLAALFLALSPWHIFWSQNARFYSLVLFISLIALGAAFQGLKRHSIPMVAGSVVMFIFAGLCHPSAYLVAAAALVYLLFGVTGVRGSGTWLGGKWAPLTLISALVVLVILVLPVLEHSNMVKGSTFSLFHLLQTLVFYVGIPMLVAAGGGMLVLFDRGERAAAFLTSMTVLPLLGLFILSSSGMTQMVTAQYAFAVLPPIHMLAAVLVISLVRVFNGRGLRPLVLRLVPLAMVVFHMLGQDYLYFVKEYGWRPRWSEAVNEIRIRARQAGQEHLFLLTTNKMSVEYYFQPERRLLPGVASVDVSSLETYSKIPVDPQDPRSEIVEFGQEPERFLQALIDRTRDQKQDLWIVLMEPDLYAKDRQKRADVFLRRYFRQVRRYPNWTGPKDMTVLVYHYE